MSEGETQQEPAKKQAPVEYLEQPLILDSTGITGKPTEKQLAEWAARAQRVAPFGPARQLVIAFEVEIWATDDRPLAAKIVEALETYMDQGQTIENGAEIVLKNGASLRHRFVNRYYRSGRLVDVVPPADSCAVLVAKNDPRLDTEIPQP